MTFRLPAGSQSEELLSAAYGEQVRQTGRQVVDSLELSKLLRMVSLELSGLQSVEQRLGRFGLLMMGVPGDGKTTMIRAIQMAANLCYSAGLYSQRERDEGLEGLQIVTARDVAQACTDAFRLQRLKERAVLAVDDVGTEPAEVMHYGTMLQPMAELLEYRYSRRLYTILSTNLTGRQLSEQYGERMVDRLREMCLPMIFPERSYRRRREAEV